MNRILTTNATAVALLVSLAACTDSKTLSTDNAHKPAAASSTLTASSALKEISAKVTTAKLSGTVTADNDPNHLLGRPNQYTSKVTFSDIRIPAGEVSGTEKGDVERGGAVEAFGSAPDAQARAKYIQAVTKSMPALAEYDYVHDTVLVRVSRYLTPKQAVEYKTAVNELG